MKQLLNIKEASDYLGIETFEVELLIEAGKLTLFYNDILPNRYIRVSEMDDLLSGKDNNPPKNILNEPLLELIEENKVIQEKYSKSYLKTIFDHLGWYHNVVTLGDLLKMDPKELQKYRNVGPKKISLIKDFINSYGFDW